MIPPFDRCRLQSRHGCDRWRPQSARLATPRPGTDADPAPTLGRRTAGPPLLSGCRAWWTCHCSPVSLLTRLRRRMARVERPAHHRAAFFYWNLIDGIHQTSGSGFFLLFAAGRQSAAGWVGRRGGVRHQATARSKQAFRPLYFRGLNYPAQRATGQGHRVVCLPTLQSSIRTPSETAGRDSGHLFRRRALSRSRHPAAPGRVGAAPWPERPAKSPGTAGSGRGLHALGFAGSEQETVFSDLVALVHGASSRSSSHWSGIYQSETQTGTRLSRERANGMKERLPASRWASGLHQFECEVADRQACPARGGRWERRPRTPRVAAAARADEARCEFGARRADRGDGQ
jgi:hypothetical protein